MLVADFNQLREPIATDSPAGENLEYDPRFVEMMRLGEGTREQQYGATIIEAKPPEWRAIGSLAGELAGETRDLRLAVLLVESMTHADGLEGLAQGLGIVHAWVSEFWDSVHPQLDESDGNDPFVRVNSLARLCEPERLLSQIGSMPLVQAEPHTTVTLDQISRSTGEHHGTVSAERITPMEIEAAFLALPLGELRRLHQTSEQAESSLRKTVQFLEQNAQQGIWNASPLRDMLSRCTSALKQHLRQRLTASDEAVSSVAPVEASDPVDENGPWALDHVDQSISSLSRIRVDSRADAEQYIDAVSRYFEVHEPSSPVPLLMKRARRLINQDFVGILRDLAPDALVQAKNLEGDADA